MRFPFFQFTVFVGMIGVSALFAEPGSTVVQEPLIQKESVDAQETAKISASFGHLIAEHIRSFGVDFDVAHLTKGIEDGMKGMTPPLAEEECIAAIAKARIVATEILATKNIQLAEQFMRDNRQIDGISILEDGKLHYKIVQEGTGPLVEDGSTPLVRYKGMFADGAIFAMSEKDDVVILEDAIPGFHRGVLGMKEGEKRILYIHPDLGYGTTGHMPPNSLLIFEVDLLRANTDRTLE